MTDERVLSELERMSRLLALTAIRDLDERDAAPLLVKAGYAHAEAGALLGITGNAVKMILKRHRANAGPKMKNARTKGA